MNRPLGGAEAAVGVGGIGALVALAIAGLSEQEGTTLGQIILGLIGLAAVYMQIKLLREQRLNTQVTRHVAEKVEEANEYTSEVTRVGLLRKKDVENIVARRNKDKAAVEKVDIVIEQAGGPHPDRRQADE